MHQPPNVPNVGRPGRGPKLVPGLALAVEPMVTLGSQETDVARRRVDRGDRRRVHARPTSSTPSPSPANGAWVLTALDGGEARLTALGVPFGGR